MFFCRKCYHLIYKVSQQSIITYSPECVLYMLIRMVVVYLLERNTFQIRIFIVAHIFFKGMNLFCCIAYSQIVLSYGCFNVYVLCSVIQSLFQYIIMFAVNMYVIKRIKRMFLHSEEVICYFRHAYKKQNMIRNIVNMALHFPVFGVDKTHSST